MQKWETVIKSFYKEVSQSSNDNYRNHEVNCLARDGSIIRFTPASLVNQQMDQLCRWLEINEYPSESSHGKLAEYLAIFWVTFISIHPFPDDNGKTALKIIKNVSFQKGFIFNGEDAIKSYLLQGNPNNDFIALSEIIADKLEPINR